MRKFFFLLLSVSLFCGMIFGGEPPAQTPSADDPHTNPDFLIGLARVHMQYNLADEGLALLEKMNDKATPEQKFEVATMRSQSLVQKQDFAGAAKVMVPVVATLPEGVTRAQALLQMARYYQQSNANEAAEKALNDAGKQPLDEPTKKWLSPQIQQQLLQLWSATPGRLELAAKDAQAAFDANPKDEVSLTRLVDIYTRYTPDAVKAIDAIQKLNEIHPEPELQQRLAYAYRDNKQYDKAIEIFRKMMNTQSKQQASQSAFQIGQLMYQAEKKDEAIAWMKENFDKPAPTIDECTLMGSFYQIAQMHEASEEAFAKAATMGRSADEKAYLLLRVASSAVQRKAFAKAEALLQAVQADYKDKVHIQSQAKSILEQLKNLKEAEKAATPATK